LSHTRFRGRGGVAAIVLAGLMIPGQVLILPQFEEFRATGLLNTYWAIILPAVAAPVGVFVFQAFIGNIPDPLIEAARIDGAGWWKVYLKICMPLCRPAISAVAIFTFVSTWNNLLWPLLVLSNTKQMTIPVGLATVAGNYGIQYAEVMASAVLGLLPLLAVFLLFQRQIVQGIASTGIK
jgi:multiple sugar transport system permease protein